MGNHGDVGCDHVLGKCVGRENESKKKYNDAHTCEDTRRRLLSLSKELSLDDKPSQGKLRGFLRHYGDAIPC